MQRAHALLRRCLIGLVVLSMSACGPTATVTPAAPSSASSEPGAASPLAADPGFQAFLDALRSAPVPTATQTIRRDALLAAMGLHETLGADADKILGLVSATEESVAAPVASLSGRYADSGHVSQVALPPIPTFPADRIVREFLAGYTDAVGRPGSNTLHTGPEVAVASSNEGGLSAHVEATTTIDTLIEASKVTVTIERDVHGTVADAATGGQVYEETRTHRLVGAIDVCPTAAGIVNGSIDNDLRSEASTFAGVGGRVGSHATGSMKSTSTFKGQVDDAANLGVVTQDYVQDEKFKRTASADGGPEAVHEGSFTFSETGVGDGVPATHDWSLVVGDHSKGTGKIESSGDVSVAMFAATGFSQATDYTAIDQSYVASQKLWRTSRCVMVTSPTYGVESELVPSGLPAHTEDVDSGSSTPFDAGIKHRFDAAVTAPIEAVLFDGKEKVTPTSIPKPPGTLTYVAPGEDGKNAIVKLTSTSRQGIGVLVLKFHTGAQKLKISIVGTMTTSGLGVSYTTKLTVKDLLFEKLPDGTYAGSAPATAEILLGIADCRKPYVQKGTFRMTATREKVEDQALERRWLVQWDPATTFDGTGSCLGVPMDNFTGSGATGPIAGFMFVLGDLVFMERGDTEHILRSKALGPSTNKVDATVTGTIVSGNGP